MEKACAVEHSAIFMRIYLCKEHSVSSKVIIFPVLSAVFPILRQALSGVHSKLGL